MSDVASGVIHEIGNVMKSVKVSVNSVLTSLHDSKTVSLHEITKRLLENKKEIGRYLENDDQGKLLIEVINGVQISNEEQQKKLVSEMESVAKNLESVHKSLREQNRYIKEVSICEETTLTRISFEFLDQCEQNVLDKISIMNDVESEKKIYFDVF